MTVICYANESSALRSQHTYTISVNASEKSNNRINLFDVRKNFVLNCSLAVTDTSELKIHWFKNGPEITKSGYFRADNRKQLNIVNATDVDEGIYKCAVKYEVAGDSQIILYQTFKMAFKPYWSKWSPWSQCQPKCGNGRTKRRFRICHRPKMLQPPPPDTKWRCHGENVQRKRCAVAACNRDGVWSEWSDWSECSRTCGIGQVFRHRECTDGDQCDGPNIEITECFRIQCTEQI